MSNRLEREFPYVDIEVLPTADLVAAMQRRGRHLRAEAQRDAALGLWRFVLKLAAAMERGLRYARPRSRTHATGPHCCPG